MKSLDINAYGVKEMNKQEMVETNGGEGVLAIVGAIAGIIAVAVYVIDNADKLAEGFKEGYNQTHGNNN